MFALRHLIEALATIVDLALNIYLWLIIARALLSWVNPDPYNPIVRCLYNVTEPVLGYPRSWCWWSSSFCKDSWWPP
jgi:YggT family protein